MNCYVSRQIADFANADVSADLQQVKDEEAVIDLFTNGSGNFSTGEIEMHEVMDKALDEEPEHIKSLVERIALDDLAATSELKQALKGFALQMNVERLGIAH